MKGFLIFGLFVAVTIAQITTLELNNQQVGEPMRFVSRVVDEIDSESTTQANSENLRQYDATHTARAQPTTTANPRMTRMRTYKHF